MGSFILNINNRIIINSLQSLLNKNGVCCRGRHVFSYRTSNYCTIQHFRNSKIKKLVSVRFASTNVNIIETPAQVSSSVNVAKTINPENVKPSILQDSDTFFIVDQNRKVEVVSSASKPEAVIDPSLLPPAPLPPGSEPTAAISDVVSELIERGVEPTLKSLGLASSYYPTGWLQSLLEYLHVTCGMPWWGAIATVTVMLRIVTLPVFLYCRQYAVRMSNYTPMIQEYQVKITKARIAGNQFEAAQLQGELMQFYKDNNINPMKGFLPMLVQLPVFMSFFYGLREMAELPVESLKTGGVFWFTDLTVPDQYYLLPLSTSVTLWLMLEYGSETVKLKNMSNVYAKYAMRALPFGMMFITIRFPSAVLCYWTATNAFSFVQIGLLRIKKVREMFGIPEQMQHKKKDLPLSQLGFIDNVKQSMANAKLTSAVSNRERLNAQQFAEAGRKPLERTFKKNPLLAQSAKNR